VAAADGDGTEPANLVRYHLEEGSTDDDYAGKALENFSLDSESGAIVVTGDLAEDLYDEYRVRKKVNELLYYCQKQVCKRMQSMIYNRKIIVMPDSFI